MANENVVEAALSVMGDKIEPPGKGMMATGQILACDTGKQYIVERMLGAGRYGEVYKVALTKDPEKKFALKLAENKAKSHRLKTEALIFEEIEKASSFVDKTRFVKMHHHGRTPTFKYYLMDLIWLCLDELVGSNMSPSTLIQVARQSLQGIEALHNLGYMHRDVGPWCFAVGMPPKENFVYLLDFGSARSHKNPRVPRSRENFTPQWRYASIAAMEEQDPTRKDDICGWLYMILELYDRKNLPWRDVKDVKSILRAKQDQQKNWLTLTKSRAMNVPINFYWINTWIMKEIKPQSAVDFTALYRELSATATMDNLNESLPFDWFGKRAKSPEKVSASKKEKKKEEKKKKKRKCTHATQQDVQTAMDDLLDMIEKQKKLLKKQQEELLDDDEDEDDESDSSQNRRRRKKKGSKSKGASRNSGDKRRRKKDKKRSRDKAEPPARPRISRETGTSQDAHCEEGSSMTVEPFTVRKKPARREGTIIDKTLDDGGEQQQPNKGPQESSDLRSEGAKTIEVEVRTKEDFENREDKKTRADDEFELVSVKGMEPDKTHEWNGDGKKEKKPPVSKLDNSKKANGAAPVKKEAAASNKK